jgi:hypothetical protein
MYFLPHLKRLVRKIVAPAFSIGSMGQTRALALGPSLLLQYLGHQHTIGYRNFPDKSARPESAAGTMFPEA